MEWTGPGLSLHICDLCCASHHFTSQMPYLPPQVTHVQVVFTAILKLCLETKYASLLHCLQHISAAARAFAPSCGRPDTIAVIVKFLHIHDGQLHRWPIERHSDGCNCHCATLSLCHCGGIVTMHHSCSFCKRPESPCPSMI